MDNVTHALAGLLLGAATVVLAERRMRRPATPGFRRAALVVGLVAAELPDIDVLYSGGVLGIGKLGYLLHHRGHTHTVVFAVVGALAIWGIALLVRPALRARPERHWLLGTALAGTLVTHILLDWTNNYGVHPFWPLDGRWYYGDFIFIVEPWLWVAIVPGLALSVRSRAARAVLGLLLVAILALAWRMDVVGRGVAIALTVGAAASVLLAWAVRVPARRVALAAGAFVLAELAFLAASRTARATLRERTGDAWADAALTPAVGNPLCINALVVERDGAAYRVTAATAAPLAGLWPAARCEAPAPIGAAGATPSARVSSAAVAWGQEWSAPVAELRALARDCRMAAALRFIRIPVWERAPGAGPRVDDLRYGRGAGSFAEIVADELPADVCAGPIPSWVPPRQAMLAGD